jgi:hypothetical protein
VKASVCFDARTRIDVETSICVYRELVLYDLVIISQYSCFSFFPVVEMFGFVRCGVTGHATHDAIHVQLIGIFANITLLNMLDIKTFNVSLLKHW